MSGLLLWNGAKHRNNAPLIYITRRFMRFIISLFSFALLISSSATAGEPIEAALRAENPTLEQLQDAIKIDYNPGYCNGYGNSHLHTAVSANMDEQIHLLMTIPQIQKLFLWRNEFNQTAIELAIVKNKFKAFKALLSLFPEVDGFRVHNRYEWTLAHYAAFYNRADMLVELGKAGLNLNVVDKKGWTALDVAVSRNAHQSVTALLKMGGELAPKEAAPTPEDLEWKRIAEVDDAIIVKDDTVLPQQVLEGGAPNSIRYVIRAAVMTCLFYGICKSYF